MSKRLALGALLGFLAMGPAGASTICTLFADAGSGKVVLEEGRCDRRVTPASTFKIAISLMGYDAGILKDAHEPAWPYKPGYPDWIESWKQTTDPTGWMKNSVVWYSQQITIRLGEKRFADYVHAFGYGNEDLSGDPAKHDGLTRSWLGSSLQISPREQLAFLEKFVTRRLPVSPHAFDMTDSITELATLDNGWTVHGKTGAGRPKNADGTPGRTQGWFVGWATKAGRTLVFVRQVEDEQPQSVSPGLRTRDAMMKELPALLDRL